MKFDIYYYSLTGNIRRFLKKSELQGIFIGEKKPEKPFVLITNTLGFGEVPQPVQEFLKENSQLMIGVCSSGHKNWGDKFAKAGDIISKEYGVPLFMKFELSGEKQDVEFLQNKIKELENNEFVKTY